MHLLRRLALILAATFAAAGCSTRAASEISLDERLKAFPTRGLRLERPVDLRWNAYAVPWITAATDRDLAYTLGLVHAHLRGGQMQVLKRIAQGRVSEMAGPLTVDLDHGLRIIGFERAAASAEAAPAPETRAWLEAFAEGLNDYQRLNPEEPPEFAWLGLDYEPWTVRDVLTIGRLAGTDVNWLTYLAALPERGQPDFARRWRQVLSAGGSIPATALGELTASVSRSGSNSVAIAASHSQSGAPLIANDPHLGQTLPNFWLLAGMRSPSYAMVGLMPPGLPFVGVGAGEHAAWGGTNMRTAASDLVDVSNLEPDRIRAEETVIKVRALGSRKREVRITPQGGILSDAKALKRDGQQIALRWVGYEPSDEIGAFLKAARAKTPDDFRAAFSVFAVSAQNIVFATREGHIGHVYAARLPKRDGFPDDDPVLAPAEADRQWGERWSSTTLPLTVDPATGFIVSANDRPQFTDAPLGFYFSGPDRVERLRARVSETALHSLGSLAALQQDVTAPRAARLAVLIVESADAAGLESPLLEALRGWSGAYDAGASAPVAFETLLHELVPRTYGRSSPDEAPALAGEWNFLTRVWPADFMALPSDTRARALAEALHGAAKVAARYPAWGDMHRLRIGHLLAGVPVIGERFVVADLPASGSRETIMKTAHGLVAEEHHSRYGSQSRHVSDLSDLDANHFVLLGGNDGWIGSVNFADQMPLWRAGLYLRMPLSPDTVAAEFPHRFTLAP